MLESASAEPLPRVGRALDAIDLLIAGKCCAAAERRLETLDDAVERHLSAEAARPAVGPSDRAVEQSGQAIALRLADLRRFLHAEDLMSSATCVADLREMFAFHAELDASL